MEDKYWKKRYEKCLEISGRKYIVFTTETMREEVEEEIETEEIEHEGTVEDAKVRKATRHDTP